MANKFIVTEQIDACLPQTQCGLCGYNGCQPYAEAISRGEQINRCPPGGTKTLLQLAALLKIDAMPLLAEMTLKEKPPQQAKIREAECIGCTKCIQACPVDAIIGSSKQLHTVISSECTGCGLCVAPCPVDCIDIIAIAKPLYQPERAKQRYLARTQRLRQEMAQKKQDYQQAAIFRDNDTSGNSLAAKKIVIEEAVARAKAKKAKKIEGGSKDSHRVR